MSSGDNLDTFVDSNFSPLTVLIESIIKVLNEVI